jgi:hypothetical protein
VADDRCGQFLTNPVSGSQPAEIRIGGATEIVASLKIHPKLGGGSHSGGEFLGHPRRNPAPAVANQINYARRNVDVGSQLRLRNSSLREFFPQKISWMNSVV